MTPERCLTCGAAVEVSSYRPHLLTDEAVERAARELHRLSDDVLPFDLPSPRGLKRRHERRERYLTTARAALEAALGGAT